MLTLQDLIVLGEIAAIFAVFLLLGKVIKNIVRKYVEPFAKKTKTKLDDIILSVLGFPLYLFLLLAALYASIHLLSLPEAVLSVIKIIIKMCWTVLGGYIVYEVFSLAIAEYGRSVAKKTKAGETLIKTLGKVGKLFIAIGIFIMMLHVLGFEGEVKSAAAGLGIAGIAIALAAQETLSNFYAGMQIVTDMPFRVGDRIMLESGEVCDVVDVGVRSTKLYDILNHHYIIVPNSKLATSKIVNLTEPDPRIKLTIPVAVAYGTDIRKVKKLLMDIAKQCPYVVKDSKPVVYFVQFGDFALHLELKVWIKEYRLKKKALDDINMRIKDVFEKEGIEIPFPIRTVYLKKSTS